MLLETMPPSSPFPSGCMPTAAATMCQAELETVVSNAAVDTPQGSLTMFAPNVAADDNSSLADALVWHVTFRHPAA